MTLGEKLKLLRKRRGWSQRQLARRSGIRPALLSELESNKKGDTTGQNLRKLAQTLGVTVDYLTGMYNGVQIPDPNRSPGAEPSPMQRSGSLLSVVWLVLTQLA